MKGTPAIIAAIGGILFFAWFINPTKVDIVRKAKDEIKNSLESTTKQGLQALVDSPKMMKAIKSRDLKSYKSNVDPGRKEVEIHRIDGWRISRRKFRPVLDQISAQHHSYVAKVDTTIDGARQTIYLKLSGREDGSFWIPHCRMHTLGFYLARFLAIKSMALCRPHF